MIREYSDLRRQLFDDRQHCFIETAAGVFVCCWRHLIEVIQEGDCALAGPVVGVVGHQNSVFDLLFAIETDVVETHGPRYRTFWDTETHHWIIQPNIHVLSMCGVPATLRNMQ